MNLKLVSAARELQLSSSFKINISPFKRRTGLKPRYGKDGAVPMGDGMADGRTINFEYDTKSGSNGTRAELDLAYRTQLNEITGFFDPIDAPFYLHDLTSNIRTQVVMSENSDQPNQPGLEYILGKSGLALDMISAFWEDIDEQVFSQSGAFTNNDTFSINNNSLFTCYPIFEITAQNEALEFTLTNTLTSQTMTLASNSFTAGATYIINTQTGSITLDGVESSIDLADGGGFISIIRGINTFLFESNTGIVDIVVKYRRRYAH